MSTLTPQPTLIDAAARQRIVLEPRRGWQPVHLGELWAYRDLLKILALRDIRVRYKQTALGVLWAFLQPLMYTIVFTVLFGYLAGFDKGGERPYALLTLAALLPWQLFSTSMSNAGNSLISNGNLISKVYFPRLVIPLSTIVAALADFGIAFGLLAVAMLIYGVMPGAAILALPLFIVLAIAAALAVGLWLSALNVEFRDVRYVVPFLVQMWMYVTPVMIPTSELVAKLPRLAWLLSLNPMFCVVEGFRWALLGTTPPNWGMFAISATMTMAMLVGGLFYFRRMEKTFADLV